MARRTESRPHMCVEKCVGATIFSGNILKSFDYMPKIPNKVVSVDPEGGAWWAYLPTPPPPPAYTAPGLKTCPVPNNHRNEWLLLPTLYYRSLELVFYTCMKNKLNTLILTLCTLQCNLYIPDPVLAGILSIPK